jgi:hypothetical protein
MVAAGFSPHFIDPIDMPKQPRKKKPQAEACAYK